MRYTVRAERGDGPVWVLQCLEHPGAISETRRLAEAPALMREAISWVADVPEADVEVDVQPVLPGEVSNDLERLRAGVAAMKSCQKDVGVLSSRVAASLRAEGLTGVDVAAVLGVSPQRVSQLLARVGPQGE